MRSSSSGQLNSDNKEAHLQAEDVNCDWSLMAEISPSVAKLEIVGKALHAQARKGSSVTDGEVVFDRPGTGWDN